MRHGPAGRPGEYSDRLLDILQEAFGLPRPGRRRAPLDELILTVLSQHTSDVNRDRAFESLRRRFPRWEDVLRARRPDVERAIRAGGLARIKSRVIRDILRRVLEDRGSLDLEGLRTMPLAEARAFLLGLRGVGEKTACCVLLFACGRPAFPVDTHIHRIARRLGWVPAKATPQRTHAILAGLIPKDRVLEAHLNLIRLGRQICGARAPRCPVCPLRRLCRYASSGRTRGARPVGRTAP